LREREPLNYDRMRNLRSHLPKREPRANCRNKTKPSSGHDHAAGIRNSFDFAASLVGGGRTVHPVSRVFRGAFHGLRVTGRLAPVLDFEYHPRRRTGWGFAFDLVRLSVPEAKLIHDCVFCRLDLPWIAIFDREHVLTFGGGVGVPLSVVGGITLCN
jgi:hypothetical protein